MIADGKEIAGKIEAELLVRFLAMPQKKVCFVLFRDDAGSRQFIMRKSRVAERLGITAETVERTDVVTTADCLDVLAEVTAKKYDGVVVQLPLPEGIDTQRVLNAVPKAQDIDVLGDDAKKTYENGGGHIPPVARAVKEILDYYAVDLAHKKILIIGKGKLVGEPVARMFSRLKIPHDIIDITTPESERLARIASADVIISGVGSPHFLKPEMVKSGVVLIDAGTSESAGKLVGDVDPACADRASLFTPVPGGVGPVTVVSLFANLI